MNKTHRRVYEFYLADKKQERKPSTPKCIELVLVSNVYAHYRGLNLLSEKEFKGTAKKVKFFRIIF